MEINVHNDSLYGALLTELFSKAFLCLSWDLLIKKLNAYGFNKIPFRLIHNYLLNKKQQLRLNPVFNSLEQGLFGVPFSV